MIRSLLDQAVKEAVNAGIDKDVAEYVVADLDKIIADTVADCVRCESLRAKDPMFRAGLQYAADMIDGYHYNRGAIQ